MEWDTLICRLCPLYLQCPPPVPLFRYFENFGADAWNSSYAYYQRYFYTSEKGTCMQEA
jgi:hypothetical protein